MADNRRTLLLELKQKAGVATAAEIDELENSWIIVGEGLAVPRAMSNEAWERRYSGARIGCFVGQDEIDADAQAAADAAAASDPPGPSVTHVGDLILCKPSDEPAPANKPGYRPINSTRRLTRN